MTIEGTVNMKICSKKGRYIVLWVYCPKCGSCGEEGCCNYGCDFCGYGEQENIDNED